MNSRFKKIICLCLCVVLALGCAGGVAYAAANKGTEEMEAEAASPTARETEPAQEETAQDGTEISKDETVYVLAGADGSVQKIIVSDWIQNVLGSAELTDQSRLFDVVNVKGDESYTPGGENTRVWDAQGHDIYYQGNVEQELPVNLTVTYQLDGKTISPNELQGKSGKVTIRFDYENKQYEMVEIDGKTEKIYVPFAMLTGVLLDNEIFTNVKVSSGKLLNDGDRTAIIGLAFPGLQENLGVDAEKFEIPDFVEITADVTNFELGTTITIATNEWFNELDTDNLDSIDDLSDSLDELTDAMGQLMDGSSQLYDGLCTLLEKSGELVDGIDQLAEGAWKLKNGAGELDTGAAQLQAGAAQLYAGLNTIAANNDTLNGGARQVFETLLSTAHTQLNAAGLSVPQLTISNYAAVLNGVIASLDETSVYNQALETVTSAVEAQRGVIEQQVTAAVRAEVEARVDAAVREQVTAQVQASVRETVTEQVVLAATGMDQAAYDSAVQGGLVDAAAQAEINAAVDEKMASDEIQQTIAAAVETQMDSETVKATAAANLDAQMSSDDIKALVAQNTEIQVQKAISENMAGNEVQAKLAAASEGAKSVISLKASLDSYNAFYLGLQSYTAGVAEAAKGAGDLKTGVDSLKAGTSALYTGADDLYNGILTLKNGAPALVEGVTQLRDGSMALSDGLKELNEQGIQKLVQAVDGDLKGLASRLRATCDVSREYCNFSGISDDMSGQVKFIYRTEEIGP